MNRRPNIPPPSHCWRMGYAVPKAVRDAEKAICISCQHRRITNADGLCMSCAESIAEKVEAKGKTNV